MSSMSAGESRHQKPPNKFRLLEIPVWNWTDITMNFIPGLPRTSKGRNVIWVVVDKLTKSVDFLPMRTMTQMNKLAELYIAKIVHLHGVLTSIISERDNHFVSRFSQSLHESVGTKLSFSTAHHP